MVTPRQPEVGSSRVDVRKSARAAFAVAVACSAILLTCRKWDNPFDPTGNRPPAAPANPSPADSGIGPDSGLVLSWQSVDPDDGDTARFDIFFGSDSPPSLVQADWNDTTFVPTEVAGSTRYYWRVTAYDNHGDSAVGPLWQFQTAAALVVTAPDSGERLRMYVVDTITWTGGPAGARRASGASVVLKDRRVGSRKVQAAGVLAAADSVVVHRSTDDGLSWTRLGQATTPGQFVWQVPEPATESARVRVVVHASADSMTGTSGRFTIYDTMPPSAIDVTSPDSTSVWMIGSAHDVTWSGGTGNVDSSVIHYSTDNGTSWTRQGRAVAQGVFSWTVPGPATTSAKIEVRAYNASGMTTGRSGTFAVVDPPYPDSVIAITAVGMRPKALCYDSIDNRVFVACWSESSLAVVDGVSNYVIGSVGVGGFSSSVLWNPTNNCVYAASETRNTVTVINGATLAVVDTVPVGAKPVAMCWNRTNNKVYVANNRDSSVTIIDCSTNQVVATAAVGASPLALAWNPVNNTVYVANFGTAAVSAIDGASNDVTPIPLAYYYACAVAVDTADNEIYVAQQDANLVSVIDGASNSVLITVDAGQKPWALAWNGTQNRVYCANSQSGTVTVIDPGSHGVETDVPVDQQPQTLWWAGPVGKLYVACSGGNSVAIIDGTANTVVRTVAVGAKPSALCWNPRDNKAYVANYDDGTVSVLGAGTKEWR